MICGEFRLDHKRALVCGDSPFWLKYIAGALAEAGADVAGAARSSQKLDEAGLEVQRLGRKWVPLLADTASPLPVNEMVEKAVSELGTIDILVNASDLEFFKPFAEITGEEWGRVMEANLYPVFVWSQAAGKHMLAQKKGRIINVISCLAERGAVNGGAYCAAAGGVLQLTRTLALEWARQGITVNAVGTGWISEMETRQTPGEEALLRYLPLKRYGHPREAVSMIVYLASDAAGFLNGQFLYADGGIMAHL